MYISTITTGPPPPAPTGASKFKFNGNWESVISVKNYRETFASSWCSVWPDGYIIYQYLTIYNNDNIPNSIIIGPSRFKIWPSTILILQKLPKIWHFLPKWPNFDKSGHTVGVGSCEKYSRKLLFRRRRFLFREPADLTSTVAKLPLEWIKDISLHERHFNQIMMMMLLLLPAKCSRQIFVEQKEKQ